VAGAVVTGVERMVIRIAEIEKRRGPLADSCMRERGWTVEK